MKGHSTIAEILQKEYNIKNLTPYEEIDYEVEQFTDEISRVRIESKTGANFCCPVYAMFDGYHMSWYGDYGFWGFDCTWKTNIMNLAYQSPYYQLEKLESKERKEFCNQKCAENLLEEIKSGDWYNYDLSDEQQKQFDSYITDPYTYIYSDDELYEYEQICEALKDLYNSTDDKYSWISAINNHDFCEENLDTVFNCEYWELFAIGDKAPARFFIILYMLSVVANLEKAKRGDSIE